MDTKHNVKNIIKMHLYTALKGMTFFAIILIIRSANLQCSIPYLSVAVYRNMLDYSFIVPIRTHFCDELQKGSSIRMFVCCNNTGIYATGVVYG